MKLLDYYHKLVLNTSPSKTWKAIRFILHWLTLPLKLMSIGSLGITQIILKSFVTNRSVQFGYSIDRRQIYFQKVFSKLPIWKHDELEVYTNRVPYDEQITGYNHNTDHQCNRQGILVFALRKLGLNIEGLENGLAEHMQRKWLARGYKLDASGEMVYNISSTSGDMLCGLNLGMMGTKNGGLRDRYYELIHSIIENDYALRAHDIPEKDEPGYEEYMRQYKEVLEAPHLVQLKSYKGRWEPGLDVVGAQALTLLASLRVADKVCGSSLAREEYKKMLFNYGYGLLSLFPTAYIDSKRGYFNDANCIAALYVLSRFSDSNAGRLFWKFAMVYVWSLSRHWFNGYFTGLLEDAHPGTVSQEYIEKCQKYLFEESPRTFGYETGTPQIKSDEIPVKYNLLNEDEFGPDIAQNLRAWDVAGDEKLVKTGIGFIVPAILLEKDPKKLLE